MKLLITILLLPFTCFGQVGFTASLGYQQTPVSRFDFTYKANRHTITATVQPNLTRKAKYRQLTASVQYGYILRSWQPYAGYSNEGFVYGLNKYLGSTVLGVGMQGKYPVFTIGTTTLKLKGDYFTGNDYAIGFLQLISGFSNGLHESIQAGHWGKGRQFWDNELSWRNKYKADGKTARFPGSTTWAVSVTDGYHFTNLISNTANVATLCVAIGSKEGRNWKVIAKKLLIAAACNRAAFYISYNKIFIKN